MQDKEVTDNGVFWLIPLLRGAGMVLGGLLITDREIPTVSFQRVCEDCIVIGGLSYSKAMADSNMYICMS